ncbi:MAG: AzlC family ABC transporter permease [Rhabdaerophilum sp.]
MSVPVTFTRAGITRGLHRGHAFALGVFIYGLAFGLVADQAQFSTLQAMLISAIVYSGSAQMAALGVLAASTSPVASLAWTVLALILVINARYLLFGATLRPWLGQVTPVQAYSSLCILGDGNWLMSLKAYDDGERDAGFVFGSGLSSYVAWLTGTLLGSLMGGSAPNPKVLGLDFMLVAFSAAMMVGMFRQRSDFGVVAVAVLAALAVTLAGSVAWAPVVAGVAGGVFAWMRFSEQTA